MESLKRKSRNADRTEVRLRRRGNKFSLSMEGQLPADGRESTTIPLTMAEEPAFRVADDYECAPDFSAVKWRGEWYYFVKAHQRNVIAALFKLREDGTRFADESHLLKLSESRRSLLFDLFKDHAAWGTMIVPGHAYRGPVDTYCLAPAGGAA